MVSGSIGERIAAYRRRRGLSQAALAGLVGRSESWLSQVERGVRSVDRLSVLLDIAKILHVEVEVLTARPWQYAPNGGSVPTDLEQVRRLFARYDHLLGMSSPTTVTLDELRARVATARRTYQAARYEDVIAQLPPLLTAAGTKLGAHHVERGFRRIVKKAGLNPEEWVPRELRHSFVSCCPTTA